MKRCLRAKAGLLLSLTASSCAYSVHDVYLSGVTPGVDMNGGKVVSSETSQHVILGFAKNTAYVEQARSELEAQCVGGRLEGLTTQFTTDLGFFSWTNRLKMKGTCLEAT